MIITPSPELELDLEGTVDIKVFLKRQRDDEVLVLKELLQELFPQDSELHDYLNEVEEIRNWSERTDDWTTFSGLLSDLESEGYDEAPHPVGLTVPLRSYQLQSLQFMLDAEKMVFSASITTNFPQLLHHRNLSYTLHPLDTSWSLGKVFLVEDSYARKWDLERQSR